MLNVIVVALFQTVFGIQIESEPDTENAVQGKAGEGKTDKSADKSQDKKPGSAYPHEKELVEKFDDILPSNRNKFRNGTGVGHLGPF